MPNPVTLGPIPVPDRLLNGGDPQHRASPARTLKKRDEACRVALALIQLAQAMDAGAWGTGLDDELAEMFKDACEIAGLDLA